jgi:hypothetical protein
VNFKPEIKIERIEIESSGKINIFSAYGELISSFPTVYERVFNSQYGAPISPDGKYLLIGTWYKGLYCYDIRTGELLWKKGPGKVRKIIPIENYVIVEMCNRGIIKRDIGTGEIVTELKMSGIECLFQISNNEIFAGPKRNVYYVYQIPDFIEKYAIPGSILNPNECLSHMIRDCQKNEGCIVVSGFEQYPHMDYSQKGTRFFEQRIYLTK